MQGVSARVWLVTMLSGRGGTNAWDTALSVLLMLCVYSRQYEVTMAQAYREAIILATGDDGQVAGPQEWDIPAARDFLRGCGFEVTAFQTRNLWEAEFCSCYWQDIKPVKILVDGEEELVRFALTSKIGRFLARFGLSTKTNLALPGKKAEKRRRQYLKGKAECLYLDCASPLLRAFLSRVIDLCGPVKGKYEPEAHKTTNKVLFETIQYPEHELNRYGWSKDRYDVLVRQMQTLKNLDVVFRDHGELSLDL